MAQHRKPPATGHGTHGTARERFGRDPYGCVRIKIPGPDWIVAEPNEGAPASLAGTDTCAPSPVRPGGFLRGE